ncbi:MAG: hypothetical protein K5860_06535 [Bacteroidales bacterium]|nr:hypothetical protein [Bacteroidales bacterium]
MGGLSFGLIKTLIPSIEPHLGKVEIAVNENLQKVQLNKEAGEEYASFVIFARNDGGANISCCIYDVNDKLVRQVNMFTLTDFLKNLISQAK